MKTIQAEKRSKAEIAMTRFWKRKDVMVVAAGSIPCIRELYILAKEMGTLHQFRYVSLTNSDYILGSAEDIIREALRKAALVPGVQVVVFYLSCLDILVRLDFHHLEENLYKETGVLVKCFYRGPLGKEEKERLDADAFMRTFPKETGTIDQLSGQLPPPVSDGAGISDWMRRHRWANVLVTPAGCRSCMSDCDMTEDQKHVYYPTVVTSDFVFGMEDTTKKQTDALLKQTKLSGVSLIGTAVPSFIGMDGESVADSLCEKDYQAVYWEADGFHDALYGVSQAELQQVRCKVNWLLKEKKKVVQILGYSPLLAGPMTDLEEGLSFLRQLGYEVIFDGQQAARNVPALNWVVSTAGIAAARWMQERLQTPSIISRPLGDHAWSRWKKQVQELLRDGKGERKLQIHRMDIPKKYEEHILFIGEPVQIMGVAHALWHEGYAQIRLSSIAWSNESEKLIRSAPGGDTFHILRNMSDLVKERDWADVVYCDPWFFPFFDGKKTVSMPWGLISGRTGLSR